VKSTSRAPRFAGVGDGEIGLVGLERLGQLLRPLQLHVDDGHAQLARQLASEFVRHADRRGARLAHQAARAAGIHRDAQRPGGRQRGAQLRVGRGGRARAGRQPERRGQRQATEQAAARQDGGHGGFQSM
jgi:hypothetical protein